MHGRLERDDGARPAASAADDGRVVPRDARQFLAAAVGSLEFVRMPSLFDAVAGFAIAAGLLLMVLSPLMRRLMPAPKAPAVVPVEP